MKKLNLIIIGLILLSSIVYSYDFIPYNNINGTNTYEIYDFTNITANDYICVAGTCYNSFAGSGTVTSVGTDDIYLTGGPITSSGTITLNETKLNETIDARGSSGSVNWSDVNNKPFNGVDTSQGLRIVSTILGINQTYFNNLYNDTAAILTLDTREAANNVTQANQISTLDTREAANNATQASLINARAFPGTCTSGNVVQNTTTSGVQCVADQDTTYTNSSPISLTGTIFGLAVCPDTQIYAYNSTFGGWQCQSKSSSGGGTVTSVSGDGDYVLGTITSSGSFTFNETRLNATIDDRSNLGTVTSVAAGLGMDFTTITGSGSVTLGNPSTLSGVTSNGITTTSHTHAITNDDSGVCATNSICGGGHDHSDIYYESTDAATFLTVNTGQGANELYDMNQNVLTTSNPTFNNVSITDCIVFASGGTVCSS